MQIKAVQVFLDGRDRFEPGKLYDVPDFKAGAFIANGWAVALDGSGQPAPQPQDIRLDIQNSTVGVSSPEVNHG
jgi:hypothetical protein